MKFENIHSRNERKSNGGETRSNAAVRCQLTTVNYQPESGLTFVEVLVALLISLAFLTSATAAFIQIMRATDVAERKMMGVNNARAALDVMRLDLAAARFVPGDAANSFVGVSSNLGYGDLIDNDLDGRVDEELADGLDNDGDYNSALDDRHVTVGTITRERSGFFRVADWGDAHVDEDVLFEADQLNFRVFPRDPLGQEASIAYAIGAFGATGNVLLRTIRFSNGLFSTEPLAFNVLSLNFLYWDANRIGPGQQPYWVTSWNSGSAAFPPPGLQLPVSVRVDLTVHTGNTPLELPPVNKLETVSMSTVVNIEQMLNDPRYDIVRASLNNDVL